MSLENLDWDLDTACTPSKIVLCRGYILITLFKKNSEVLLWERPLESINSFKNVIFGFVYI